MDDGTHLTACTQPPGNLGIFHSPPCPAIMHSLHTGRSPTAAFPTVQDTPLPTSARSWGWLFSALDHKRLRRADTSYLFSI
jgi:hypothetical protein